MTSSTLVVLSHLGDADEIRLPVDLRRQVEVARIPGTGPLPTDLAGEVLFTLGHGLPSLGEAVGLGVRWIHLAGTGIDKFPLAAIPDDVVVTNSRGASAVPISEWTLAMMLAFEKRLPESWVHEPKTAAERFSAEPLGTLHGRTLSLIGFGAIGNAIAKRAAPFGMRVKAMRRTPRPSGVADVELVTSLDDLLHDADHVVVAAPLTSSTEGMVDRHAFSAMKPGVHLVNIARGAIVVDEALHDALDDGTVALASLDAVDPEPPPEDHWVLHHPRVRFSPHISWSAPDAIDVIHRLFAENLARYLAGEPLRGVVDREGGY
jgi:phosphoglycerate dehydrogenase-like enzyme